MSKKARVILILMWVLVLGYPLLIIKESLYFPMEISEVFYNIGKYLGFCAYFVFFLQYLWTAKIKGIESIFPFDIRVAIHRSLGFIGLLLLTFHPILILTYYASLDIPLHINLPLFLGHLSFFLVLVIGGSTFLGKMFSVKYETWKLIHYISFFILTLAFFHALFIGSDLHSIHRKIWIAIWVVHVLLMAVKFVHKIRLNRKIYKVDRVINNNENVTTVIVNKKSDFKPGQFGFIKLKIEGKWEIWHPFSISSSTADNFTSFTIKNLGDFTSKIKNVKPGEKIKVDLPYGGFSTSNYSDNRYTFIAGGVGITPIFSMLSSIKDSHKEMDITLLYSVHVESDILFRNKLESIFKNNKKWSLKYILASQKEWPGEKGILTPDRVKKLTNNTLGGTYFLCGPLAMIVNIKRYLLKSGIAKKKIRVEQFVFIP